MKSVAADPYSTVISFTFVHRQTLHLEIRRLNTVAIVCSFVPNLQLRIGSSTCQIGAPNTSTAAGFYSQTGEIWIWGVREGVQGLIQVSGHYCSFFVLPRSFQKLHFKNQHHCCSLNYFWVLTGWMWTRRFLVNTVYRRLIDHTHFTTTDRGGDKSSLSVNSRSIILFTEVSTV